MGSASCGHAFEDIHDINHEICNKVDQKQRLISGESICRFASQLQGCDSAISMNMVEEHIYLRQKAAREKIQTSQEGSSLQTGFTDLSISAFLVDHECQIDAYNNSKLDRKLTLIKSNADLH